MPKVSDTPAAMKAFIFHGVDLEWGDEDTQAKADCPFCGKARKFYVNIKTGLWECKSASCPSVSDDGKPGGNPVQFLRRLYEVSKAGDSDYKALAEDRTLLYPATIEKWGLVQSCITKEWLIPGHDIEGKLLQVYRYVDPGQGKKRLVWATPNYMGVEEEIRHQLFGVTFYDPNKQDVILVEGVWNCMALWECLRKATRVEGEDSLALTKDVTESLYANTNIVGVPGCSSFKDEWCGLFAGKNVYIMYDNDHPKKAKNGKEIPGAGYAGMKRVVKALTSSKTPPKSTYIINWGDKGYNLDLKSGYDVRDHLSNSGKNKTIAERIAALDSLLKLMIVPPDDWFGKPGVGTDADDEDEAPRIELLKCESWPILVNQWRKAMQWIEGLDRALSVILACILSTELLGDQLWVLVVSPPSCLHGDTPIYDPIDGTTLSVKERWIKGEKFNVYSMDGDKIIATQAEAPYKYQPAQMYEVTFASGKKMKVTGGHKLWNGFTYVSVSYVYQTLLLCDGYRLPSISESDLLARMQDGQSCYGKVLSCQYGCCVCSYPCDEQLHLEEGIYSGEPPLQACVPEHNHDYLCVDDSVNVHGCNHLQSCHLSNYHILPHEVHVDGYEHVVIEDVFLQLPYQYKSVLHSQQLCCHSCNNLRDDQSRLQSTCGNEWGRYCSEGIEQQSADTYQTLQRSYQDCCLGYSNELPVESCLVSKVFYEKVFSQLDVSVGTSEQYLDRHQEFDNTQESCDLIGKDPPDFVLSHQTKELPYNNLQYKGRQPIITDTDTIVNICPVEVDNYYDFHVPGTENYWAMGCFHHNTGKTSLCEALSANRNYVIAKSTIKGLFSGYQEDKTGDKDNSLAAKCKAKTLIIKDADPLLKANNREQILSELRDIYDRNTRTSYRNKSSRSYEDHSMTIVLCGTASLYEMDSADLGARFLNCTIVDKIDDDLEDNILLRVAMRTDRLSKCLANGTVSSQHEPEYLKAMQLTGGYVQYLRTNAEKLANRVHIPPEHLNKCITLSKFVSYMRARPSTKQDEHAEKEFPARLTSQITRLARYLTAVMSRTQTDKEVMRRVRKVALDTSRGKTVEIMGHIYEAQKEGMTERSLSSLMSSDVKNLKGLLNFMCKIGALYVTTKKTGPNSSSVPRYRMTDRFLTIYKEVMYDM